MMDSTQPPLCGPAMEPNMRLKILTQFGNSVDIDVRVPPRRYYRSGLEMVRMANSYYEEGSLENAFILYMKFVVLFLEKIRSHPEFSTVGVTERAVNAQKLREVLPRAEELKSRLLDKFIEEFEDYNKLQNSRDADKLVRALAGPSPELPAAMEASRPAAPLDVGALETWKTPLVKRSLNPDNFDSEVEYPDLDPELEPQSQPVPDRNLKPSKLELPLVSGREAPPSVDRSTKPASLLSPSLHGKLGLRRVVVPARLMQKFLSLAQQNTQHNLETCGILAGRLHHEQLVISHLLVPKQHGTADSCTTQSEEEIFDFQDQHDLITFGWIHTHPSQTSFLSSVDLHTHCSYQRMMPEAIAIVCAPRYKESGIFMLTPNHGLDFIANCRNTGFHPHPSEPPLFQEAQHAVLDQAASIEVVDLRR